MDVKTLQERLLNDFRFFKKLNNDEMAAFLKYSEFCRMQTGDYLWKEGDPDNYAAFILSGKVGIKKRTEFNRYMIVGLFGKGTVVGELCLLTNHKRSVTASVLEDVEFLKLTNENFERLIRESPMAGLKLLRHIFMVISHRLNRSTERIAKIF